MDQPMQILRKAIKEHNDNFSSTDLAKETGLPRGQISSLMYTLRSNGEVYPRNKLNNVPQYNRLPLPVW